jgi:hypothetical protein
VKGSGVFGPSGLFRGLVSYWKLDENGPGTRADSWGPNPLTDNVNNVGHNNANGIACTPKTGFGQCAGGFGQTSNVNTRLKITDAAQSGLAMGSGKSFTCSLWTYGNSGSSASHCMGKYSGTTGQQDYGLYVNQVAGPFWYYTVVGFNPGGVLTSVDPSGSADAKYRMNAAAWTMIVWGYDDATGKMHLTMAADLATSYPRFTATCSGAIRETACDFNIGSLGFTSSATSFWGSIDEVAFWNRTLNAAEVSQIWNAGAGLPLSSFS